MDVERADQLAAPVVLNFKVRPASDVKALSGVPAITSIDRVSTPGRRVYAGYTTVPKVIGGMGVSILTTSRGVMTDAEARRQKVGGELPAKVW